jgi:hypothetical protein
MDYLRDMVLFLWSVLNNWAGYATGGVIVALVWLWSTLRQKPPSRNVGIGLAIFFLFFAFFNAWRDQYVKVLNQITFIQITSPALAGLGGQPATTSHVEFVEGIVPKVMFVQTINGDYPAIDTVASAGIEIYDLGKAFDPMTFHSTKEIEDAVWNRFISDYDKLGPKTWQPHDRAILAASLNRTLAKEEADGLTSHTKLMYVLARASWSDGAGRHEQRFCNYFPYPPQQQIISSECNSHIGFEQHAKE